jgi:hypothetical protein
MRGWTNEEHGDDFFLAFLFMPLLASVLSEWCSYNWR